MQKIFYSHSFKWGIWTVLIGTLFSTVWILLKDWQTCKSIRSLRNVQSDHVEKIKIFSLDQKKCPYTVFAEKLQASHFLAPPHSIYYRLLKPQVVLETRHYRFQMKSHFGSFFFSASFGLI
ncbi:hypothetical protein HCUR_00937 [Holospora curviuscula]|uniref:Uncharacterized protein n=1 Tax=Holospora curviuscula TaxID=1082868 RepID=A0A2S5R8I6_9PROT|nr:hypothetical protein HCUR_00937 [Holospora curviuscula]